MRKPEQTSEPSIEEILASIRRIIADDGMAAHAAEPEANARTAIVEPVSHRHEPEEDVEEEDIEAGTQTTAEDDIFELTEDSMLEAPAVRLDEPAEPAAMSYQSRAAELSQRDPYAEPVKEEPEQIAAAKPQSSLGGKLKSFLPDVMAEVRRFAEGSAAEQPQRSAPIAPGGPAAAPSAAQDWGQPQNEALSPSQPQRPASRPVWSARHKENDGAKGRQDPAATSQKRFETALRKPGLANRDDWSQGVQMPVPEGGPAIPFRYESAQEERRAPAEAVGPVQPAPSRRKPKPAVAPDQDAPATAEPAPSAAQSRAEQLADTVVSSFALEKLSAPPLADILKADKPLMEEITHSLADVIAKGNQQVEEAEESGPPDMLEEGNAAAAQPGPDLARARAAMGPAGIPNLDGGFVASRQPALAEEETPELPREDLSDLLPPMAAETQAPTYFGPKGVVEPVAAPSASSFAARPAPPQAPIFSAPRSTAPSPEPFPSLAGVPKSLEETIKEMLKPLLLQWLNENMPRIVNEVIREEMAEKGLLPRYGGERR